MMAAPQPLGTAAPTPRLMPLGRPVLRAGVLVTQPGVPGVTGCEVAIVAHAGGFRIEVIAGGLTDAIEVAPDAPFASVLQRLADAFARAAYPVPAPTSESAVVAVPPGPHAQ